jgi:hypothetical protein
LSNTSWFWVVGFFLTGLTLIILGLLIGPLGQYARKSELPPPEAEPYEQQIQQTAAATGAAAANGPQTVPENPRAVPVNNQPAPVATHQGQAHMR